jgi:hypothetical protein
VNPFSSRTIGAIATLLNKLVEQRKATQEQTQQTTAPKEEKKMGMCCDMMKGDQSEQPHQH